MDKYQKDGVIYNGGTIEYKGMTIHNPSEEMLVKAGWELYVEPEVVEPTYTEEELAEMEANRQANEERQKELKKQAEKYNQIELLKSQLSATDYKIIKIAEYASVGADSPYDAIELHAERQALRNQINQLETL